MKYTIIQRDLFNYKPSQQNLLLNLSDQQSFRQQTTMQQSDNFQVAVPSKQHQSLRRKNKFPSFISCYSPKVTSNSSEYHFVSQPKRDRHQRVTLKNPLSSYSINMYFEIENLKQTQQMYEKHKKKDESRLKTFQDLDYLPPDDEIFISKQQSVKESMWARKYEPRAFYELLSEEAINRNVLTWLKSWDWIVFRKQVPSITPTVEFHKSGINPQPSKYQQAVQFNHTRLLLLSGPPGCGKTTLARVVAKHCGYDVMELNASDDRSGKALIEKIQAMGKNNSVMNNKPTMIIIDEVDGALQQDGNGIKEVLNFIQSGGKTTHDKPHHREKHPKPSDLPKTQYGHHEKHTLIPRPIIFICNDPYVKGLKQLRSRAIVVYFRQVEKQRIVKRLKEITEKERIYIQNEVLVKIAEITNCDIRGSLGILEYICNAKMVNNQNPKELIAKLRVSLQKDSNSTINQFVSELLNEGKATSLKQMPNLKEFAYSFFKIDSQALLFQTFFHNFLHYKGFFSRRTRKAVKLYDMLSWTDTLSQQSFKYGGETDTYLMMAFLYYKLNIVNEQRRKVEFPIGFFDRLNKLKQHKQIVSQLVEKWPAFLRSTVGLGTVIKEYLWVLYYAVQTSSTKDSDIIDCVGKMITYGIQLAPRNSQHLFKPEFDSLLTYAGKKLQVLYTIPSRNFIQQSYEFAKLKSHLLADVSLTDLNKNTEQLLDQLNIKNHKRKKVPGSQGKNSIKYKFIEGSGTQIAYDLKFKYFFQ